MKKLDKISKTLYSITYGIAIIIMFFIWLFLIKSIPSNGGFNKIIILLFSIGMLLGIYSNACQIVKLYNEDAGKKMLQLFGTIYYIVFIIMWFSFLLYFNYIIIKNWNDGSIVMLIFSLTFYIPGFIMIKKVIEKLNIRGIYDLSRL